MSESLIYPSVSSILFPLPQGGGTGISQGYSTAVLQQREEMRLPDCASFRCTWIQVEVKMNADRQLFFIYNNNQEEKQ